MGKGQRNIAQDQSIKNRERANQQTDTNVSDLQTQLGPAREQAQQTRDQASTAYNNYSGGTGSFDPTAYGEVSEQNKRNITTGGYNDPEQLNKLKGDINKNVESGGYN